MNYEDARSDLDDLASAIAASTHSKNYSQRLDMLRTLEALAKRARSAGEGSAIEDERRSAIEDVIGRIEGMMAVTDQLEALIEAGDR
jgi:hypothetical protein